MSDVKPFRVVMKLRNNRMASIRGKRKQKEMDLLCKVHGGTWGAYEGLKKSPIILDRSGQERCYVCATRISRQAVVCSEHGDHKKEAESLLPGMWSNMALRIAAACSHDPSFLWPECIVAIDRPQTIAIEISAQQLDQISPSEEIEKRQLTEGVHRVLDSLTVREDEIIAMRFGLRGHDEHTFEQIAKVFGISKSRISQIEAKALMKIKYHPEIEKLDELI